MCGSTGVFKQDVTRTFVLWSLAIASQQHVHFLQGCKTSNESETGADRESQKEYRIMVAVRVLKSGFGIQAAATVAGWKEVTLQDRKPIVLLFVSLIFGTFKYTYCYS